MGKEKDELPSEDKSHEQNVKVAIDSILGSKTKLRKAKKTPADLRKDNFCKAIVALSHAVTTDMCLVDLGVDLEAYSSSYMDVVDNLFKMMFSPNQISFIDFYLYDRFTPDGEIISLELPDGKSFVLRTPEDLYEFINKI